MFYSADLLSLRRRGKLAKCWLAAMNSERAFRQQFKRGTINKIKLRETCDDIMEVIQTNPASGHIRFSLYLSIQLIFGATRIFSYQIQNLLTMMCDIQTTLKNSNKKRTSVLDVSVNGNAFQLEMPPPLAEILPDIMPEDLHLLPENPCLDAQLNRLMHTEDVIQFGAMTEEEQELFFGGGEMIPFYPLEPLSTSVRHLPETGTISPNINESEERIINFPATPKRIRSPTKTGSPLSRRSGDAIPSSPYSPRRDRIVDVTGPSSPFSTTGKRIPTDSRIDSPSKRRRLFGDKIPEESDQQNQIVPPNDPVDNNQLEPGIEPLVEDPEPQDPINVAVEDSEFVLTPLVDVVPPAPKLRRPPTFKDVTNKFSEADMQDQLENIHVMTRPAKKVFRQDSLKRYNLLRMPSISLDRTGLKLRPMNNILRNIFNDRFNNICEPPTQEENYGDSRDRTQLSELNGLEENLQSIDQGKSIEDPRRNEGEPIDLSEINDSEYLKGANKTLPKDATKSTIQDASQSGFVEPQPIDDTKNTTHHDSVSLPIINDTNDDSFLPAPRDENSESFGGGSETRSLSSQIINKHDLYAILETHWTETNRVKFSEIVPTSQSKLEAASALMCLLELAMEGKVVVEQAEPFSEIFISQKIYI